MKKRDKEIIDAFEICFQELKDKGYKVDIKQRICKQVDFTYSPIIYFNNILNKPTKCCFRVKIYKYNIYFNIKDIKENLLSIEAYMKDIFNINITLLYTVSDKFYYENIKYLPLDKDIYYIKIHFTKD